MIKEYEAKTSFSLLGAIACLFMTSGCVIHHADDNKTQCTGGICTSNQEYTATCQQTPAGYSICTEMPPQGVNYTRTAADFREYGERTPRDYRVTQAGAGNNMSAVVRPSIEDEVVDYEAQVNAGANQPLPQTANGVAPNAQQGATLTPAQAQAAALNPNQYQVPDNYKEIDVQSKGEDAGTDNQKELNKDWLAEEGQSLKDLLTAWSEEAGWRLIWKTNRNYTLNAGAMFRGNFADVSSALVRAFARARPAPIATFYKGNRVLVIETMEDENAYD